MTLLPVDRSRGGPRSVARPGVVSGSLVAVVALASGAAVAVEPVLGAALLAAVVASVMIARRPDWATLAAVAILYSNAAVVVHRVHGVPKPVSHAAAMLLLVALAHHLGVRRAPLLLPPALPWAVAFLVIQVIGAARADAPGTSLGAVGDFTTSGLLLFVAFVNALRTESVVRRAVWTVLAVGAILGALSIHQSLTGSYGNDYLGFAQVDEESVERHLDTLDEEQPSQPRLGGPIGEKNYYAQFMFVLIPFGLVLSVGAPRRRWRVLALGLAGLIAAGGALTASRGGAVGLVLALVTLAVLRYLPLRHLLLAALGISLIFATSPRYLERLSSIGSAAGVFSEDTDPGEVDGATLGRLGANAAAVRVFADHPMLGVGPDMFNSYYRDYAIEAGLRVHEGSRAAHNLYLHVAAETGILGFVAFFGAIAVTLRDLARERRRCLGRRPVLAALLGGAFGSIVTYLTTGLFLSRSYERYFWFLLALAAATVAVAAASANGEATGDEDEGAAPGIGSSGGRR